MSKTFTLRAGFSRCSDIVATLTNATKLFSEAVSPDLRINGYVGTENGLPSILTQIKLGNGESALYFYEDVVIDRFTEQLREKTLRTNWSKRSPVWRKFCGITLVDFTEGQTRVRLYATRKHELILAVRVGEGRNAKYTYKVVLSAPNAALAAIPELETRYRA